MICYVDTHVAVWLAEANLSKLSRKALSLLQNGDIRISPMAVLELQYLYEIRRIIDPPPEILLKLSVEIGLTVCDYAFPIIADLARGENWTRDPFDRLIVAHAKANGMSPLISSDELIQSNYPKALC